MGTACQLSGQHSTENVTRKRAGVFCQPPPRGLFSSCTSSQGTHLKGKLGLAFGLFPYNEADDEDQYRSKNPHGLYQDAWLEGSQDAAAHDKETCEQTPKAYGAFLKKILKK